MRGVLKSGNSSTLLAGFSILLATLSLGAAFYQNYIYTQLIQVVQRNVARGEYIRTCRDIIETYFQVKLKVGLLMTAERASGSDGESTRETEATNAVSRFAALGTYLANFQDEDVRFRYTQLSRELSNVVMLARNIPAADFDKSFAKADELFGTMNEDCVRTAKTAPL